MWEMIPPKKAVRPSKEQRKYMGMIEYIEKRFQKYFAFSLYALLVPNFREKQLTRWLCGDLNSP
jgi:hypothetical protein